MIIILSGRAFEPLRPRMDRSRSHGFASIETDSIRKGVKVGSESWEIRLLVTYRFDRSSGLGSCRHHAPICKFDLLELPNHLPCSSTSAACPRKPRATGLRTAGLGQCDSDRGRQSWLTGWGLLGLSVVVVDEEIADEPEEGGEGGREGEERAEGPGEESPEEGSVGGVEEEVEDHHEPDCEPACVCEDAFAFVFVCLFVCVCVSPAA